MMMVPSSMVLPTPSWALAFTRTLGPRMKELGIDPEEMLYLDATDGSDAGIAALAGKVPTLVVTCGAEGATAVRVGERATVPSVATTVVDTTGAGDLFASGFLFGHVNGEPLETCLKRGAICAAEIISHYGARPEADLKALMTEKLG